MAYLRCKVVLEQAIEGSYVGDGLEKAVLAGKVAWFDKVVLERGAHGTAAKADTCVRGSMGGGSK